MLVTFSSVLIDGIEIDCIHQTNTWTNHGSIHECIVYGLHVSSPQEPITSVKVPLRLPHRRHFELDDNSETNVIEVGNDKDKYISFYIYQSPSCYYVPSGIADNFQNLKVLVIAFTGLKEITHEDLKPLVHLENLYIDNNQLESLEKKLFVSNPQITTINLSNNRIKHVAPQILEPLTNLQKINFSQNVCVDFDAVDKETILELIQKLETDCQ